MARPPLPVRLVVVAIAASTACGDGDPAAAARTSAPTATRAVATSHPSSVAPTAAASAAERPPAAVAPVTSSAADPRADGGVDLDLGVAGDAWKGLVARAPAGSTAAGDGGSGALVLLGGGRPVTMAPWRPNAIAEHRLAATTAATVAAGAIAFETDERDGITYVLTLTDAEGRRVTTRGFAMVVDAGFARFVCAYATARDDAELAAARAVCTSVRR